MHNHAPPGYECFVCNLVAGDASEGVVVTENERALAIVALRVWASGPGHVLVVPKQHYENLYDLEDDAALDIHRLARRIAIALKEAFGCDGTSTRQHNEPAGNQDLWHLQCTCSRGTRRRPLRRLLPRGHDEERLDFAAGLQAVL